MAAPPWPNLTFPRRHQPEWQPFPSPSATPNSDKFGPQHTSPLNSQNVYFDEADRLWANMNTPTSNFSNFDLALNAHHPLPPSQTTPQQGQQRGKPLDYGQGSSFDHVSPVHPGYQIADSTSFQQSTSFVQQYPPTTATIDEEDEGDSCFVIHTPPPTRDASSRRRVLQPKSRSTTPSAGRPAVPRTVSTSYMPAITDSSPSMQLPLQQTPNAGFMPPQMHLGPQFSPEYFRPQPIQQGQAPPPYFHASSAPTWHTSYEPPNPFDQDPFVSPPQFSLMPYDPQLQNQPLPTSGQAARAAQQQSRSHSNSTISLDLTPALLPGPAPNQQVSPTRTGSVSRTNSLSRTSSLSRQRSIRKGIPSTQRLAQQHPQLAPAPASGVDPSKLMQPRPGAPTRSQSFTAGTTVPGPYEHYHKEAQRERERMQSRLRAEGPSPLKRPRVNRGLVVDANGRASVVELP